MHGNTGFLHGLRQETSEREARERRAKHLGVKTTDRLNGYDYRNQAWVKGGVYLNCAHANNCGCFARVHRGEAVANDAEVR